MLKRHTLLGCFACLLSLATWAHGQAVPTASRGGSDSVGIGGVVTNPDYGQSNIEGLTFCSHFDFVHHYGVEGEIHYYVRTPTDSAKTLTCWPTRSIVTRRSMHTPKWCSAWALRTASRQL